MASEVIKLNLIPKGEMPVFHASQFDTGRLITCELYRGEDAYSVPEGYTVELHCRKVDNNIVTMASTLINDNVVTFTSTEQLTACNGNNFCEVAILDEGYRIGTLNFILEVEIDPLKGGITSTSEIHNLESQVEEITTEVIGENYYNKTEVDVLLDAKADASSVYTKSETDTKLALKANAADVYTKGQVDTALAAKADVSDLPDMDLYYTKTQVDSALALKANAADVYTKGQVDTALASKADVSDLPDMDLYYTKTQVDNIILDIMPVDTAGPASIASFDTALAADLVDCVTALDPSLTGYTAVNLTACGVNLYSNIFSEYRKPVNYYIKNIPLKIGTPYTLKATLKGTAVSGVYVGITSKGEQYSEFQNMTPAIKTDGTTLNNTFAPTSSWTSPKLIIYCSDERQFNSLFENYDISLTEGTADFTPYTGNAYAIALGDTYYGGTLDVTTGVLTVEYDSSLQPITPYDVQLSPAAVRAIVGDNNVYSDTGDTTVQYKDTIQNYIDKKVST